MIPPGFASIHAEFAPLFFESVHKRMRAELTTLVSVHNLRPAVASERLLQHSNRMTGLGMQSFQINWRPRRSGFPAK
jgi:hypothetical protein